MGSVEKPHFFYTHKSYDAGHMMRYSKHAFFFIFSQPGMKNNPPAHPFPPSLLVISPSQIYTGKNLQDLDLESMCN